MLSLAAGWQVTGVGTSLAVTTRQCGRDIRHFPELCTHVSSGQDTAGGSDLCSVPGHLDILQCVGGYMYLQAVSGAEQSVQFLLTFISITPHFTKPQPAADNNSQIQDFLTNSALDVQPAQEIIRKFFDMRVHKGFEDFFIHPNAS